MDLSFNNKVVLVTGASRGIGQAIAMGMAQAGADVAIASRKLADLEKVAESIKKMGRKCLAVPAHIGKIEEVNNLVNKVMDEFGKIDILVNNAATNPTMASAIDIDDRAWDSIMNLNLKGLFFLSQAVARTMKEKGGGKIINVASIAGIHSDRRGRSSSTSGSAPSRPCRTTSAGQRSPVWDDAPAARVAHAREEHLIPLMVAAGAADDVPGTAFFRGELLSTAMSCFRFD